MKLVMILSFAARFIVLITGSVSVTQANTCEEVQSPQHGEIIASDNPPYAVGTILTFKCDKGFKGYGKEEVTCLRDGKWSGPVPYCRADTCQKELDKIEEGRRCRKRCKSNADCENTLKICQCDDWCGKSCIQPGLECPALRSPQNGYIIGSKISYGYTITYGCNNGYLLTGADTRRCRSDGKWSGKEPKCVAKTCEEVKPPQHGEIIASGNPPYAVGTILTLKCDRGFKGYGKEEVTCLEDGKWSGPVPYCRAYTCQKRLDKIEEGRRCRKGCKSDADCKNTFKICQCDDWCGKSCIYPGLECPHLTSPQNGYIIGSTMSYGYTITYGCNNGYLLTGTDTRRCRSDGKWSGNEPKCVAFSTCGQRGDKDEPSLFGKVIDGTDAKVGAWPWQTYLFRSSGHDAGKIYNRKSGFGGGSIIDDKWILTAAHVFNIFPKSSTADDWKYYFLIATGITVLPEPGQAIPDYVNIFEPRNVYIHSKFDAPSFDYDVALIRIGNRLKKDGKKFIVDSSAQHNVFTFSRHIRPVCLPCIKGDRFDAVNIWKNFDAKTCDIDKTAESSAIVTGFGYKRYEDGYLPKKMQEGLLKIFDEMRCVESVKEIQRMIKDARFTDRMLCAGSANESKNVDACQGDSGGPLVIQFNRTEEMKYWIQVGIVSWGVGCGNEFPGYYIDVASVMAWVWKVINDTRPDTWQNWSLWTKCSTTCGSGKRHRHRICAEENCPGPNKQEVDCSTHQCPEGTWHNWSLWTGCSTTCGPGKRHRHRICAEENCLGPSKQEVDCSTRQCPEGTWHNWSLWTKCSTTCGLGKRYRHRICAEKNCPGPSKQEVDCSNHHCPKDYKKCGQAGDNRNLYKRGRVVNGENAPAGAWPWQALICNYHKEDNIVENFKRVLGGGSLINDKWILTAAHLFAYDPRVEEWQKDYMISLGIFRRPMNFSGLDASVKMFHPEAVYTHEAYEFYSGRREVGTFTNDIALIRIGLELIQSPDGRYLIVADEQLGAVTLSPYIRPVCLPCSSNSCVSNVLMKKDSAGNVLLKGNETSEERCRIEHDFLMENKEKSDVVVVVTGFGHKGSRTDEDGVAGVPITPPMQLQQTVLKVEDRGKCKSAIDRITRMRHIFGFTQRFTSEMFCATGISNDRLSDSCQGDAGGPVTREVVDETTKESCFVQLGIVSFGYGCAQTDPVRNKPDFIYPGFYTDVTSMVAWINKTMTDNEE